MERNEIKPTLLIMLTQLLEEINELDEQGLQDLAKGYDVKTLGSVMASCSQGEIEARMSVLWQYNGQEVVVKSISRYRWSDKYEFPSQMSVRGLLEVKPGQARVLIDTDWYVYFDPADFAFDAESTPCQRESDGLPTFLIRL